MPRKQKKYHYLYKTTNLINNKFYVGMHSTDNLEDGYLGSGKRLKRSVIKYGKENFKIEYLEFFEDRKTLVEREKNFINEDLIKDPMCMNLAVGGEGGILNDEHMEKLHAGASRNLLKQWQDKDYRIKMKSSSSRTMRKYLSTRISFSTFSGKTHSIESKNKIGIASSMHQTGIGNSQFGTCWITNNIENKKIKKEELNNWLNIGWVKGRIK